MKTLFPCLVALVLPFVSAAQDESDERNEPHSQIALDPYTVVVLPFEVVGEDPRAADLAAAAYDDIVARLAAIEGLYVLGPASLSSYIGSDLSPAEIARQLGAAHAITGSVWVGEFSLDLDFERVNAETGEVDWASGMRATPGERRPIKVYPDKLLANAVPPVIEQMSAAVFPEREPDPQQRLADLEAVFLDVTLSERERLEALQQLPVSRYDNRASDIADAGGAVTGELSQAVMIAAVQIAASSDDHWMREGIWIQLRSIRDPYLVQPLLNSLANDDQERVRLAAATALRNFIDEPGVREALEDAGDNDPSADVRHEARFSVISPEEQRTELIAIALDTSRADRERSEAFRQLRLEYSQAEESTCALISAMINLAEAADDGRVRRSVWRSLADYGSPDIVEPLLEALSEEPDEEVREAVVEALGQFLSEPAVRESLEAALTADRSVIVRRELEEVLGAAIN